MREVGGKPFREWRRHAGDAEGKESGSFAGAVHGITGEIMSGGRRVRKLVAAAVSHPWFRVMLFLVAVPAPSPFYASSGVVMAWAALFLALLVLGFIGYKAFVWRKSPREGAAADNPWLLMVLLLLAGPGITGCALPFFFMFFCLFPSFYNLPLFLVLGFMVFRGLRRGETPPEKLWRLQNPWGRALLFVIGLPSVTVYLSGMVFSMLFGVPILLFLFYLTLLCLYARIEHATGRLSAKDGQAVEGRRPNPWFSLVRRIAVFFPLPFIASLLQFPYHDFVETVPGRLSLLLDWLPLIVPLGFCVCRAIVWKPPQEEDA